MDAPTLDEAIRNGTLPVEVAREAASTRLDDLSLEARAALINRLQRGVTSARDERAIRDIFLGTHGADLTRLKRMIDRGRDHRDLFQLLYHDIDKSDLREEILAHIRLEAEKHPSEEVKVLSDVDDTFYRNWVDPRYPARTVYPGVLQLYKELEGQEIGDIVFLTGRPGDRYGKLEGWFQRGLGGLGAPEAAMLTGSFVHQLVHPWVLSRKWSNFERYRQLYPEFPIVMLGDSGQADPEFIGQALERYPRQVLAGLVHRVKPLPPERAARCLAQGVFLFDTYVGAANRLHQLGLLGADGLRRVAQAAISDMEQISFPSEAMRQARLNELASDLKALPPEAAPPPPENA